jgi:alkylated DNA nucleotide flippase Atl1
MEEKIYEKLIQVPSGKIITYGELARSVGLQNGQPYRANNEKNFSLLLLHVTE